MFARTSEAEAKEFPFRLSDAEWRARLSPEAYRVLRGHGTEYAGSSPLNHEKGLSHRPAWLCQDTCRRRGGPRP